MFSKVIKYTAFFLLALTATALLGLLVTQRVSDGPIEFLQGGPFKTGEVVETPVTDWSFAEDKDTQFELVGYGTSRTAGFIMHDGIAYMTCDLGFMWNRLEPGMTRNILHLIYIFKQWHQDAVADGRARLRVDGKIYKTSFVKVEDPALTAKLKARLEVLAAEFFGGDMGPPPASPPNDVWFFRMDPATW